MHRYVLMIIMMFWGLHSWSQAYQPRTADWFFYDASFLMLRPANGGFENGDWSNGHTISILKDMTLGHSQLSVAIGVGYTSNNHFSNLTISVNNSTGESNYALITDSLSFSKNKFNAKYVEIPVELRFRTKPNRKGNYWRIYGGFKAGYCFNSYSLVNNGASEVRYYHLKDLNRFTAGAYARVGWSNIGLVAYYGLMPLFDVDPAAGSVVEEIQLEELKSMSIGVSIAF